MSKPEEHRFSFKYGNILQVDGAFLNAKETSPELFEEIMHQLGHSAIEQVIENIYQKTALRNKDVAFTQRASVWLINLGTKKEILTPTAYARADEKQRLYRDAYSAKTDLAEQCHPYWETVSAMNLIPIALESTNLGGFCLSARDQKLDTTEI